MFDETATNPSLISKQTGSSFSGQNYNDILEEQLNSDYIYNFDVITGCCYCSNVYLVD